jgi:hypothetical protein
MGDGA